MVLSFNTTNFTAPCPTGFYILLAMNGENMVNNICQAFQTDISTFYG